MDRLKKFLKNLFSIKSTHPILNSVITIANLNDDCLLHIFHRLPLSDRINLHRVCSRWRSLQSSVTQTTTKSLTLNIAITEQQSQLFHAEYPLTIPYLDQIDPASKSAFNFCPSLTFPTLTPNITTQLTTLLPHIESVQLNIKLTSSEVSNLLLFVNQLLRGWSDKLVTLEFYGIGYERRESIKFDDGVPVRVSQVIRTINSEYGPPEVFTMFDVLNQQCLTLRNFAFFSEQMLVISDGYLSLSCLARLNTFRFSSRDRFDILFNSLRRYAVDNEQLNQIHIENSMRHSKYLTKFPHDFDQLHPWPTLIPKLTTLSNIYSEHIAQCGAHLSKFVNLATLTVGLDDFVKITAQLATLPSLVHLSLVNVRWVIMSDCSPTLPFARLPSVKIVSFRNPPGSSLESSEWAWILPSIELVEYQHFPMKISSPNDVAWTENAKQILKPIIEQCCTSLKRAIAIGYYDELEERNCSVWIRSQCRKELRIEVL